MKSRLWGALCACLLTLATTLTHAAVLPLESRLGGLAYYDPNLNITWTADANINSFTTWDDQVAWAAGLSIGGVSNGWRLPSADVDGNDTVVNCSSGGVAGCEDNEMGYLFWEEGITSAAPGPFSNLVAGNYWSGTELASDPANAWLFFFSLGTQRAATKDINTFAWAVHPGDVAAVPIPAAMWLFGSGIIALVGVARKRRG